MTLEGTNTYLVGRDPAYVIDPGPADDDHIDAIHSEGARRGGIAAVLLTHSHADHAAAAGLLQAPLLRAWPGEAAGPFEVIATPGHADDHVCFVAERTCFAGDLILGEGSSFVPPDGGSLTAYLSSLRLIQEIELELIYPGHGPPITDPEAKIAEYIEHRLERERKLVEALQRGERSRRRLLAAAWDDVPERMHPVAAIVMQAHLDKLEAEGRLPAGLTE